MNAIHALSQLSYVPVSFQSLSKFHAVDRVYEYLESGKRQRENITI
jgi:hypothetical protein